MGGQRFSSDEEIKETLEKWLKEAEQRVRYDEGIQKLVVQALKMNRIPLRLYKKIKIYFVNCIKIYEFFNFFKTQKPYFLDWPYNYYCKKQDRILTKEG